MAKFFTSAKIFVRNIVHFLLDELCTLHHSRIFRVPPKELEIVIQEEKKLWTFPKTSVRLMSSCQHFCIQSRQYLFTRPLGLTAVQSCKNLIFRRYSYQNLDLPVDIDEEKAKSTDDKSTQSKKENDKESNPKDKIDHRSTMTTTTTVTAQNKEDSINSDFLDATNLYNSTSEVEIVTDDAVNLPNDNINRLPLNLQNLINEVEIETQIYSELINEDNNKAEIPKIKEPVTSITPLKPHKKFEIKTKPPDIVKKEISVEAVKEEQLTEMKDTVNTHNVPNIGIISGLRKRQMIKENRHVKTQPKLTLIEIQKLAKKMYAMGGRTTNSVSDKVFVKPISIVKKSKPSDTPTVKSKIPVNTPYIDSFLSEKVNTSKVDIQKNPVIVERKQRMEMIKKTLSNMNIVPLDSVSEIKTMSNAMTRNPKIPTLLSLASKKQKNFGEGTTSIRIQQKPLPFRVTKETNIIINHEQPKILDSDPTYTLSSDDIRKKFSGARNHMTEQRSKTVPYRSFVQPLAKIDPIPTNQIPPISDELKTSSQLSQGGKPAAVRSEKLSPISIKSIGSVKDKSSIPLYKKHQNSSGLIFTNQGPLKPSTKSNKETKVAYDNMTRNMNTTPQNSWSSLLSHSVDNKTKSYSSNRVISKSKFKNKRRFNSMTSGYDSDFSNDPDSFDQESCKEDDYNMIEVKVKKHLPYLQSHRPDSSMNLTGLVDRSIAHELRMREIEESNEKSQTQSKDVAATPVDHNKFNNIEEEVANPDDPPPVFDTVRGIYCNQILCPSSSDVLTRYMNYSSQTESEDFKTKINGTTPGAEDNIDNKKNKEKDKVKSKLKTCVT